MTPLRWVRLCAGFLAIGAFALCALPSSPARGASVFGSPIVVVYPLSFAGAVNGNEAGSNVSLVLAQKLADGGQLSVKAPIPGTVRAQYLDAAISQRADYYVTGFLQTIGADVSMIVQVVSTHSGSVVFSTTTTIRTFGDAALQADPVREAILRHAGRGYASLDAPAPASVEPSTKPTNGPGLDLSRALRKRRRATPTPSASPASEADLTPVSDLQHPAETTPASPVPPVASPKPAPPSPVPTQTPSSTPTPTPTPVAKHSAAPSAAATGGVTVAASSTNVLVVDASGGESPELLAQASDSLVTALRSGGVKAARLPIGMDAAMKNAATICAANAGTSRFYAPSLVTGHDDSGALVARLSVASIDCTGTLLTTRASSGFGNARGGEAFAIDRAAAKLAPLLAGT